MNIKIKAISKKIGNEIPLPSYSTSGSAAVDLRACINEPVTIKAGEHKIIDTGIAISIPEGYVALMFSRSGLAVKSGIALRNSVGVIDSDYRGELHVGLVNNSKTDYIINEGDRIAQLAIMPVVQVCFQVVDELDETDRGTGGYGSTGKS